MAKSDSKILGKMTSFIGGIADSPRYGVPYSFAFGRALDFRTDPSQLRVNPQAQQQASGIIADLPMWADLAGTNLYFYGNAGYLYLKNANDTWSVDHIAPSSSGNGLVYFAEDQYLYYAQNTSIGRKSFATTASGNYYDSFLESEGGDPTNPAAVTFARASSQYADIATQSSLEITLDLAFEAYVKFSSLPSSAQVQTLMSKWNENSNERSYKFDLTTSSNSFGDGSDGSLHITSDTTESPIDSACTGTTGTKVLSATNASFTAGQKILIHQTRGTGAGQWQVTTIDSYTAGTIITHDFLTVDFVSGAQVRVLKQYSSVTIDEGVTYLAKAWNGTTGGIIGFLCSGTYARNGVVSANGKGFRGGSSGNANHREGQQGEGFVGSGSNVFDQRPANGNGGGAGSRGAGAGNSAGGGGGGGNGTAGTQGTNSYGSGLYGQAGSTASSADLTTLLFGGGGGQGGGDEAGDGGAGGPGGGIVFVYAATVATGVHGGHTALGLIGANSPSGNQRGCGGGGAGGSLLMKSQTAALGSNDAATGGVGGSGSVGNGGDGGTGVIVQYYSGSVSGTTTPTVNSILDTTLSNVSGYVLRVLLSSDGANSELYTQDVTSILQTNQYGRFAFSWDHATSTASFYRNGILLGTQSGAFTSIFNSTANFALGASFDSAGTARDFLDAKLDDVRLWNATRSQSQLLLYNDRVLTGLETNLVGYWKMDEITGGTTLPDSQTYTTAADLTIHNTPTVTTDVGFSGATTRADQDVNIVSTGGQTYTLGTSISEAATARRSFQPTKEPLKSIQVNIDTVGTGDWTVTLHDGLNRVLDTVTVANAQLHTGLYEFVFPQVCRPVLTAIYHVHITSTVADGKIVTSTNNKMEGDTTTPWLSLTTGSTLGTFFQILVDDIYHPMIQFQNFIAVGNERYVAKLEAGNLYSPHQLTLPAGYRVRCFALLNEYLAIGVWKGDSITDTDQGKIFLWDGSADVSGVSSPNFIIDVLEGGVNAMKGAGGLLNIIAGYKGKLLQYGSLGVGAPQTQKVKQFPLLASGEYCEVAPGAMNMWQSVLQIGGFINTDSSTVHEGVYSYGKLNIHYPDALGFDYPLSLGDQQSSAVKVGCVFPQGRKLYIGWQNGNSFGIDRVVTTNAPYSTATIELLINPLEDMTKLKQPVVMRVDHDELKTGQSITLKYKPNRQSSWNVLRTMSQEGATGTYATITQLNRDIQLAVDIGSNSTTPTIYQISMETQIIPSVVNDR